VDPVGDPARLEQRQDPLDARMAEHRQSILAVPRLASRTVTAAPAYAREIRLSSALFV
jgi:hypothetical protein